MEEIPADTGTALAKITELARIVNRRCPATQKIGADAQDVIGVGDVVYREAFPAERLLSGTWRSMA